MNILIVEDNLAHQKITEYVLKHNKVSGKFFVVRDGQDALDYLFHKNAYADEQAFPTPDLILLDLNLPKRDGREVLKVVKEHPAVRHVPVVIVSTSDREEDITYAMQTGAAAYISKSSGFDTFNKELSSVLEYARKP
jgi:CheY-like chemotaxis protein